MDLLPSVEGGDGNPQCRPFWLVLDHDPLFQQVYDEFPQFGLPQILQLQGHDTRGEPRLGGSDDPDLGPGLQLIEKKLDQFLGRTARSGRDPAPP